MQSDFADVVMCLHAGAGAIIGFPGAIANPPYKLAALARSGSEIGFPLLDFRDRMGKIFLQTIPEVSPSIAISKISVLMDVRL